MTDAHRSQSERSTDNRNAAQDNNNINNARRLKYKTSNARLSWKDRPSVLPHRNLQWNLLLLGQYSIGGTKFVKTKPSTALFGPESLSGVIILGICIGPSW